MDPGDSTNSESVPDGCDFEPALEFDDTELAQATEAGEVILDPCKNPLDLLESPMSDSLMDENYEELLDRDGNLVEEETEEEEENFEDIAKYNIIEFAGDDPYGRTVIVISACKLPSNKELNHARFLRYLMHTLDQFVESDYTLVYFHYGLSSHNKLPLSWLWKAYRTFDRKYKKNLKALYLVHPTKFIKIVWQMFRPVISAKFGKKMMYVNYLHELKHHLHYDQLAIPQPVLEYVTPCVALGNTVGLISCTFTREVV
ncbi:ARHGAP1 [Cordylochernes scorpioides]|uniref:ARHGAP1 n=1 Tax=Cordylochernes scorpioides TaxID=51811 RepID=A0ABY6KYH3_9ARAC|nr:ARHGAP1 [Cordylochernes scorpioides]